MNPEQHSTPSKKRKILTDGDEVIATISGPPNDVTKNGSIVDLTSEDGMGYQQKSKNLAEENKIKTNKDSTFPSTPEHLSRVESPQSSSGASESDWTPPAGGALDWIYSQIVEQKDPRHVLDSLMPNIIIPSHLNDWDVWRAIIRMLSEPPKRTKLPHINTFDDVVRLIRRSQRIMVLTGAGISVSCGIPDFRSRDGVYARLAVDFPDLPNPEAMFSIAYFKHDPRPFFKFAKEIYPGQFKPSIVHKFIALLEKEGKLLRNYTQNIDTLEQVAGITRVVQCHGSFATASCQVCKHKVDREEIREDVFNQVVPRCPQCPPGEGAGILKPDIVFFGENLPDHFHRQMTADKEDADLLIVIGSALKVRPVALIPNSLPEEIPQILINREPLTHMGFDVELLGDGDGVVAQLCRSLGEKYQEIYEAKESLKEITKLPEPVLPCDDTSLSANTNDVNASTSSLVSSSIESSSSDCDATSKDPDVDKLRGMWQSRWKQSISKNLPDGTYYYNGGHRYIFPGAEIAPEEDSDCSSDSEDGASSDGSVDPAMNCKMPARKRLLLPKPRIPAQSVSALKTPPEIVDPEVNPPLPDK